MVELPISPAHGHLLCIECNEPQRARETCNNVVNDSGTAHPVFSPPSAHFHLVAWELSVPKTSAYLTGLVSRLLHRMERTGTPNLPAAAVDASDPAYLPEAQKTIDRSMPSLSGQTKGYCCSSDPCW